MRILLLAPFLAACATRFSLTGAAPMPRVTIAEVHAKTAAMIEAQKLAYVSDYLSFVGSDGRGHVALAIDSNRGKDGDKFQAEHYTAFHDEHDGWQKLTGQELYANPTGELFGIPESKTFRFEGSAAEGWMVTGLKEPLVLKVDPLVMRTWDENKELFFAMASAPATLTWKGRTIPGRVICELLVMRGSDRLSQKPKLSDAIGMRFHGLYLLAGRDGDVYLHGAKMKGFNTPPVLGFINAGNASAPIGDLTLQTTRHAFAPGFFRWP